MSHEDGKPASSRYPADLYAATHTGTPGDAEYYRELCAQAEDVLELGCGFGRILDALQGLSCRYVGLDLDPALLELARARSRGEARAEWVLGDMRELSLQRSFDLILVPHSGLYCLLSDDEVLACLRGAYEHLRPGGLLAMDAYSADEFHEEAAPQDLDAQTLVPVAAIEARGCTWEVFERSSWDPATQRILATYIYLTGDRTRRDEGQIDQRYLLRPQLHAMLASAGFVDIEIAASFAGEPEDAIWVARARRPDR